MRGWCGPGTAAKPTTCGRPRGWRTLSAWWSWAATAWPGTSTTPGAARRGAGCGADRARIGVPLRALQREGGGDPVRGRGGRERGGRDRHRGDEHADASPARDGGVVHDDAPPDAGPVRPRHRAGHRPAARHHGDPADHDGADGGRVGLYRRLWRGEAIFGHEGPAGSYPLLSLGVRLRRGHPGDGGVPRLQDDALGRAGCSTA